MIHIGIVGAGAAGLMAASHLLDNGPAQLHIHLFERNPRLGVKVRISGGGRCNVTTGRSELGEILRCYPRGSRLLRSPLYAFPPTAVRAFFEERGVPLKCEADLRVFPVSDKGDDIVGVFEQQFRQDPRIKVYTSTAVTDIQYQDKEFILTTPHHQIPLHYLILTTGGQAYRHTGSKGDGYTFAEQLGHSITPLAPSLHSFLCKESWIPDLAGVSMPHVHLHCKGTHKHHSTGPMLWTHKGVTGPAVFALSASSAYETFDQHTPMTLHLDLMPDTSQEQLLTQLTTLRTQQGNTLFKNTSFPLPKAFLAQCATQLGLAEIPLKAWAPTHFHKLVLLIKDLHLHATAKGQGDEFVTAGGIPSTEINKATFESSITPGLYFAGEILDIDGITGGYNLQVAWCTGRFAATHLLASLS